MNEWSETAELVVEDCLDIHEKDQVLLVVGDGVEKAEAIGSLYAALKEEICSRGLSLTTISYRADVGIEAPLLVEKACCEADVIIFLYVRGLLHSGVYPRIQRNKKPEAKILMLPNGNAADFANRLMPKNRDDFYEVAQITEKVGGQFLGGEHTVHLTAPNGTDLSFTIGKLNGWNHTGIAREPGDFALLPAGSLNIGVDEGSAQGRLVVDTFASLRESQPGDEIDFEIRDGSAYSITGSKEADGFLAEADKYEGTSAEKFCIAEFGLGFLKAADYHISLSESENMYGVAHIGIGSNATFGGSIIIPAWHEDVLLPNATVELDGRRIARRGEYLLQD